MPQRPQGLEEGKMGIPQVQGSRKPARPCIHSSQTGLWAAPRSVRMPTYLLGLLLLEVLDLLAEQVGAGLGLLEGSVPVLVVLHGLLCWKEPCYPLGECLLSLRKGRRLAQPYTGYT